MTLTPDDTWPAAETFEDLCELGARFLEGDLDHFPGWGASAVDDETDEVAALLAACCRRGFLTVASQPGSPDGPGEDGRLERRRAFVTGFVADSAVQVLGSLVDRDLVVVLDRCDELPLGLRGSDVFLALGPGAREAELDLFASELGPAGLAALETARWACALDPEWGRDDRLWPALAAAFGTPYP